MEEIILNALIFTAWTVLFIQEVTIYQSEKTAIQKLWVTLSGILAIESFLDIIEYVLTK